MTYIGIDFAWSERAASGVCVLNASDALVDWIVRWRGQRDIIDARLCALTSVGGIGLHCLSAAQMKGAPPMPHDRHQKRMPPAQLEPAEPQANVGELLSRLPTMAGDDYVTKVMELSEAAERSYRSAREVGAPLITATSSTDY
jgi:hypothetical protein